MFLGVFPRYTFEALGVVSIAVLGCILILQRSSGVSVIPLLGVLAIGGATLASCFAADLQQLGIVEGI